MAIESIIQEFQVDLNELRNVFPEPQLTPEMKLALDKYCEARFGFVLPAEVLSYSSMNYHLECDIGDEKGLQFGYGCSSTIVDRIPYSINFITKSEGKTVLGINGLHGGIQSIFPVIKDFHNTELDTLKLKVVMRFMVN